MVWAVVPDPDRVCPSFTVMSEAVSLVLAVSGGRVACFACRAVRTDPSGRPSRSVDLAAVPDGGGRSPPNRPAGHGPRDPAAAQPTAVPHPGPGHRVDRCDAAGRPEGPEEAGAHHRADPSVWPRSMASTNACPGGVRHLLGRAPSRTCRRRWSRRSAARCGRLLARSTPG